MRLDRVNNKKRIIVDLVERFLEIQKEVGFDVADTEQLIKIKEKLLDEFILAVCGEVKAGKSTFINALLGEEILPMDVLQCTSSILEICYSEYGFIKVNYHNNKTEEIRFETSDEANDYLKKIAQIQEQYRDIPTTILDGYIVANVELPSIDELEKKSSLENLKDKRDLIEKYVYKRRHEGVPIDIIIGYPFKYKLDSNIRIVDTPGVNAVGGVQDITFDYIKKADALIFIHPITSVESESFLKFVKKVINEVNKEFLFLVLTHKGNYPEEECEKLVREAQRIYRNYIKPERIIPVDSVLRLIWHKTQKGVSLSEIKKDEAKRKLIAPILLQRGRDKKKVKKINEASNFDHLEKALINFLSKAPDRQMSDIIQRLKTGYENIKPKIANDINLIRNKIKPPQSFVKEVENYEKQIKYYQSVMNKISKKIENNYLDANSRWQADLENIRKGIKERTNCESAEMLIKGRAKSDVEAILNDCIELLKKVSVDIVNKVEDVANRVLKEVGDKLRDEMNKLGQEFKAKYNLNVPEVDIESIKEKTEKESCRIEPIYKRAWWTLWLTKVKSGEKREYDPIIHLGKIIEETNNTLNKEIDNALKATKESISKYLSDFYKHLSNLCDESLKHIEELRNMIKINEELLKELNRNEEKIKRIKEEVKKLYNLEKKGISWLIQRLKEFLKIS